MAEIIDINGLLFSIRFILKFFFFGMLHDYNTGQRHESVSESDSASSHDPLVKLEENIINCINNLKEEIGCKMKMKNCEYFGKQSGNPITKSQFVGQYGRRNNLLLSGIPENIPNNQLENTFTSILSNNVAMLV